jgi:flagellar basal-body rod protein FlgB
MDVMNLMEKALNVRARNQKVIASNISNVDTPGYKEKAIDFPKELERQLGNSKNVEVHVVERPSEGYERLDENSVVLEDQVMKMTENSLYYDALVQTISKKFSMMRYVISEGRR